MDNDYYDNKLWARFNRTFKRHAKPMSPLIYYYSITVVILFHYFS